MHIGNKAWNMIKFKKVGEAESVQRSKMILWYNWKGYIRNEYNQMCGCCICKGQMIWKWLKSLEDAGRIIIPIFVERIFKGKIYYMDEKCRREFLKFCLWHLVLHLILNYNHLTRKICKASSKMVGWLLMAFVRLLLRKQKEPEIFHYIHSQDVVEFLLTS